MDTKSKTDPVEALRCEALFGSGSRYPITDQSILQCSECGKAETGISARTRIPRHARDRGWLYADCYECGGGQIPINSSPLNTTVRRAEDGTDTPR